MKRLKVTVLDNPWIPHRPTEKQAVFLSLPHEEGFYGGAAGGGKSDALLMGALQYVDRSQYAALLLRRTYADLALPGALMDRAHEWLGGTAAKWNDQKKQYRFPSGATLNFGYLENERDKYRYQSAEFHYIAPDELTQFTPSQITYLFSRLRRREGSDIPIRFRGASNPGNIGHEFVKQRYVEPGNPKKPFIPAKLDDNPYLDQEAYRKSLAELAPFERKQLEEGIWDEPTPEGAYFNRQYELAFRDGRITYVPWEPALPVYTYWDLGTAKGRDSMTVGFVQLNGSQIRFIRAYGTGGEGFPHFASYLSQLGYTYREHWAPHDIKVVEVGTGKTRVETAISLGINFQQVPNIGFDDGIEAARKIFHRVWFDKTNCAPLLRALKNYRKEWDDRGQCWKQHPVKDWTNDWADMFRMFAVAFNDPVRHRSPRGLPPSPMAT